MLDQCDTRLVTCSSGEIPVSFRFGRCSSRFVPYLLWFVTYSTIIGVATEMLDMQSTGAITTGCNR